MQRELMLLQRLGYFFVTLRSTRCYKKMAPARGAILVKTLFASRSIERLTWIA
jgi:hypothetical protein